MRRLLVLAVLLGLSACSPAEDTGGTTTQPTESTTTTTTTTVTESESNTAPADFEVASPAFGDGATIPVEYTCDGPDISPELNVVGIPVGAESLAMIVSDPDAPVGTWDHWVEFDISIDGTAFDLAEATPPVGTQGVNSWNLTGYMGPCPPDGEEHRYVFIVFAVDTTLELPAGVDGDAVRTAMDGHVIDSVEVSALYGG